MAERTKPIEVREDYTLLMKCIADLHALVLPMVEPQEARPSKRTQTGLSVEEREARAAFQLMKEKKRWRFTSSARTTKDHRTTQWSGVCGALCAKVTSAL
jgi:hypothetical protein